MFSIRYIIIMVVRISYSVFDSDVWNVLVVFCRCSFMLVGRLIVVCVLLIVVIVLLSEVFLVRLNENVIVGNWLMWLISRCVGCCLMWVMLVSGICCLFGLVICRCVIVLGLNVVFCCVFSIM